MNKISNKDILRIFDESNAIKLQFIQNNLDLIMETIQIFISTFLYGNKVLIFGNGGSASDSQHMAAEFVNRLNFNRDPLPAISLTTDASVITSISNDFDYVEIFSKQIKAIGRPGDLAVGITTSGNSKNVINGIKKAKSMGLKTICLTGNNGGKIVEISNLSLIVPSKNAQRIQETHIIIIHTICELVEKIMFEGKKMEI